MSTHLSQRDGLVSIENDQLCVQDPLTGGVSATIFPGDFVHIYVNEEEIFQETKVVSDTHIRITLPVQILPLCSYDITLDEAKMRAFLTVHILEAGYRFRLAPIAPTPHGVIRALKEKAFLRDFPEVQQ